MRSAFAFVILAAAAAVVVGQTNQCHFDCYNFKNSAADGQMLKGDAVTACKANNVAGNPTFSAGPAYFQAHAGTAPEADCTLSVCTPFMGAGYGTAYSTCEHATAYWKALTNAANTTSNAARANANVACTACPAAS